MSTYTQVLNNLDTLELSKIKEEVEFSWEKLNSNEISFIEKLNNLLEAEINFRDERAKKINITVSHFPFNKTINDFDFSYQPSINKNQILNLTSLNFIETKTNIIFMGSPGTGKTHLATALGIEAASQRIATYFVNFSDLMAKFKIASIENRVEKVVKHYLKYTLLIIDEIGYLPVDKDASSGFFQLIAARYEKRPTILTTNQPFSKRADVFGDPVIANAIIDRLVHHCEIIKINGLSYRIRGKSIYEEES